MSETPATSAPHRTVEHDPSAFPSFAVTVDVVIFTLQEDTLKVLLVERGQEPFRGMWAIPGGFKTPHETLDEAASRELVEETGVAAPGALRQFAAYGDPGRDPRLNVVTVAYLAVLRDVGPIDAGTDAAAARLFPATSVVSGRLPLAFDHRRIVTDAVTRVRSDLETTGLATSFIGSTFTLRELRAVYENVWGQAIDAGNFRRSLLTESGWLKSTGKKSMPGPSGGKPSDIYRAGPRWKTGSPVRRSRMGKASAT